MNPVIRSEGSAPAAGVPVHWEYLPPPPRRNDSDAAPIDIGRAFGSIRRRAWLVVLLTLLAGGAAYYWVHSTPRQFSAKAVVQLVDSRQALTSGLVNGDADQPRFIEATVPSQLEILQSRAVAAVVVDSELVGLRVQAIGFPVSLLGDVSLLDTTAHGLIEISFARATYRIAGRPDAIPYGASVESGGLRFTVRHAPGMPTGSVLLLPRELAIDVALLGLNAAARKQTNVIDIRYRASDPVVAQRVANRIALAYQIVDARLAQQQSRRRREFIEQQLARNDAQLNEAERALSDFRTTQQAYSSQQKFDAQQKGLADLDVRRQELDAERKLATRLLHGLEVADTSERRASFQMLGSAPDLAANPVILRLYTQLIGYETSLAELTTGAWSSAPSSPDAKRLDSLIASTQRQLVSAVQSHIALLDARLESIDDTRSQVARTLQQIPAAEAAGMRLEQNASALREQGSLLRSEYQQARIAEAAQIGQVEILDLAGGARQIPKRGPEILLFAMLLGAMAGAGAALGLDARDHTVKGRDQVESAMQLTVLATVPQIRAQRPWYRRLRISRAKREEASERRDAALAVSHSDRVPGSEAYRHLRASVFHSRGDGRPRIVLVTSPGEGDGKTSVACNSAITLAQQQLRVLLIDCDLYRGKLHKILDFPRSPGLSDMLIRNASPADAIHETLIPNLSFLSAGGAPSLASDALGGPQMGALLKSLATEYDAIILDCSPALAVSDSAILSVLSDAVLLVIRAGKTTPDEAREALRHLEAVRAPVIGAVLNDPDGLAHGYTNYEYGYQHS